MTQLLGRPYALVGEVVPGRQLGRTLGFPTANLALPREKFLPRKGVYRVRVNASTVEGWGVMNIGDRPTVAGQEPPKPTIEVHLLDWSGDLYGQTLTVELESFLRPEQKFASLEDLKAQIQLDCQRARSEAAELAEGRGKDLAEEGDRPPLSPKFFPSKSFPSRFLVSRLLVSRFPAVKLPSLEQLSLRLSISASAPRYNENILEFSTRSWFLCRPASKPDFLLRSKLDSWR